MTLDDFTDLAFRRLENPGDATLRAAVEQALSDHPEWVKEWRALRETDALVAEALPIALELNPANPAVSAPPPVPWAKLAPAAEAPSPRTRWRWMAALAAAAAIAIGGTFLPSRNEALPAPARIAQTPGLEASLANALRTPLVDLLATLQPVTLRAASAGGEAWIQQPFGAALAGPLTIAWSGGPADLTLRQRGQIIWQATRVTSPTASPALPADGLYELTISLRDPTGTDLLTRFITTAETPALAAAELGPFAAIVTPLASSPARLGEAAAAWRRLNIAEKTSPTGVRLGLWLGVNARQPDIWAEAQTAASNASQ